MLVVRKMQVDAYHPPNPLDVCLDLWVRWQRRNDDGLSWHRRAVALEGGGADSAVLYDCMDTAVAEAVEAMIWDLPQPLGAALRRRGGIATAWRFPSLVFADTLVEAEAALEKKLKAHIATRCFFG